jgi:hypothetical protein
MRFYNLGYPTISLAKDLLVLDRALAYRPDMVVWLVTLEAMPVDKQLSVPLLQNNPSVVSSLLARYRLDLPGAPEPPAFWERTLAGRRKDLADLFRLQLYGVLWAATGVDQAYPAEYPPAQVDLEPDPTFHGKESMDRPDLALEVLAAGQEALGDIPLIVVNEPILISGGANSEIRYNFYYPRPAYDRYRVLLAQETSELGIEYVDAWDLVGAENFTNSAIHLDRAGTGLLADEIKNAVLRIAR